MPISLWPRATLAALAFPGVLGACATVSRDVSRPEAITFGASLEQIIASLEGVCARAEVHHFDPPRLPGATTHDQIDCQGFDYFGEPRLAEFVFMDDRLVLTWILVDADDIDALESAFISSFGDPTHVGVDIKGFAADYAAVRRDVPEALYYWKEVAPVVEGRMLAPEG